MLQSIFLFLFRNGLLASALIVLVIVIRWVSGKRCNHIMCILWGLVAIRLICPISFEEKAPVSVEIPIAASWSAFGESNGTRSNPSAEERSSADAPVQDSIETSTSKKRSPTTSLWRKSIETLYHSGGTVWAIGFGMIVVYYIVSALMLRRKVVCGLHNDHIILCDEVSVPFVYGILRPRICIPSSMSEECRNDVLAHEETHILYGHHIWKLAYAVIAAVYWFHPAVWIAYSLFCRDLELACDDKVVSKMGEGEKKNYIYSLLTCSGACSKDMFVSFSSGRRLKERTENVLKEKNKQSKLKIILIIIGFIALSVSFIFGIKLKTMKAEAEYSLERLFGDNATDKFDENNKKSLVLLKNFRQYLPYQGKYKPEKPIGDCKMDSLLADDYPAYYAGYYFNVDGQLVVMIKESYFKKKYRKCDWYKELVKMFASEDFTCCSRKYSYPDLINAMSDVSPNGSMTKLLNNAGVEHWGYGIDNYENRVDLRFGTEDDAEKAQSVIRSDIYNIYVSGEPNFLEIKRR